MSPTWLTLFIDLAPDEHALGTTFWLGTTGYTLSPVRGEHGEFTTLVPPHGDDHLRIQRLGS
ncbi:MAG: VOC family protein, partial [Nocardioides sp.]|nr:VOC family protein [Nocardioides sp.]